MRKEVASTTDTVTQEWIEAFDARIAENVKQSVYRAEGNVTVGEWVQRRPFGVIDIVDGKRVFTPFPADEWALKDL